MILLVLVPLSACTAEYSVHSVLSTLYCLFTEKCSGWWSNCEVTLRRPAQGTCPYLADSSDKRHLRIQKRHLSLQKRQHFQDRVNWLELQRLMTADW